MRVLTPQIERVLDRVVDALGRRPGRPGGRAAAGDFPTLADRAHLDPVLGSAVVLDDDHILRNVDETPGQIAESAVFKAVSARPFAHRGSR